MRSIAVNLNRNHEKGERHMKNLKGVWAIVFVMLMAASFPSAIRAADETKPASDIKAPEEDKVTGEAAVSFLSAYIWRGQELTRHSIVVQPSATLAYKGVSLNVWGNIDTRPYAAGDEKYGANYTETDITLSYSRKVGPVTVGAGYIYYGLAAAYAGGPDYLDSQELFVTVSVDTLLSPTLTVFKEIDHYHQWYATLGISHTFALHEKVGLKLAGQISYLKSEDETTYPKYDANSLATADKFNNFHEAMLTVSLPVAVTKNLTVTPLLTYVFPLSEDARYEMRGRGLKGTADPSDRDSTYLYGGVTLSFAF
jgi:hypothetical protein